jgi:hypothetical protein
MWQVTLLQHVKKTVNGVAKTIRLVTPKIGNKGSEL